MLATFFGTTHAPTLTVFSSGGLIRVVEEGLLVGVEGSGMRPGKGSGLQVDGLGMIRCGFWRLLSEIEVGEWKDGFYTWLESTMKKAVWAKSQERN